MLSLKIPFLVESTAPAPPLPLPRTSCKYVCCVGLIALLTLLILPAQAATLTYQNSNKWVATEDNKPLLTLMQSAKSGQTRYSVRLPQANRPLSLQRLLILKDILTREAAKPVILEETTPAAKPNTLIISPI